MTSYVTVTNCHTSVTIHGHMITYHKKNIEGSKTIISYQISFRVG